MIETGFAPASAETTHQFFLSSRTIYVVCFDLRHPENKSRVEFWLQSVLLTLEHVAPYSKHPIAVYSGEMSRLIRAEMKKLEDQKKPEDQAEAA